MKATIRIFDEEFLDLLEGDAMLKPSHLKTLIAAVLFGLPGLLSVDAQTAGCMDCYTYPNLLLTRTYAECCADGGGRCDSLRDTAGAIQQKNDIIDCGTACANWLCDDYICTGSLGCDPSGGDPGGGTGGGGGGDWCTNDGSGCDVSCPFCVPLY